MIDPKHLDFGEVWETDQFEWTIPVRNRGTSPIRATSLTGSCSCIAPTVAALIPPNEVADLKFRVDLRVPCASAEAVAMRDARIQVVVGNDTNPSHPPLALELRGRVRSALAIGAKSVGLGRTPAGLTVKTRSVPIRSLMALRELTALPTDENVARVELIPSGTGIWDARIVAVAPLPVGVYKTAVRFQPVLAGGEKPPPISLPIEFEILGDVQPDTSAVVLGVHRVGSTAEGQVTLQSLSGRPFTVEKWTVDPVGGAEVIVGGADGASHWYTIRQRVMARGDQSVRIRFEVKDGSGRSFEVTLQVRSYGFQSAD